MDANETEPEQAKTLKCPYTHDTRGNPLPAFILDGSVAYAPIIPKPVKTVSQTKPK